jgi:hypothetical protein
MRNCLGSCFAYISLFSQIFLVPLSGLAPAAFPAMLSPAVASVPASAPEVNHRAVVRHSATINNGHVEGSIWQLTVEDFSISGNTVITEDLLVPGTPGITSGGNLSFGGTIIGSGSASPSNYTIRLSGNASLRNVITRSDPVSPAPVDVPLLAGGNRDVILTSAGESLGDPTTLRNLTLGGSAGEVSVPAGTYGDFAAGDQTSLVFGIRGSTQPSIYDLKSLVLSGHGKLLLAGPVILTVADRVTLSGSSEMGAQGNPDWLDLRIAGNILSISGASKAYAFVQAPAASATVNGGSQLIGSLVCDALAVDGNGIIRAADTNTKIVVQHAVAVSNGRIEASVRQQLAEDFSLSGNSVITGDLLVPGSPLVTVNGVTSYAGMIVGTGSASPSNYSIRLSGNASMRYIMTRTDPITMPSMEQVPAPTGTRDLNLKKSGETIGDPATLRDLRLSGQAGMVQVPEGTYGTFTASNNTGFVFGVTASSTPAVYNLQSLTLSGQAQLLVLGPVVINVANGVTLSGQAAAGYPSDPKWVLIRVASGDLSLSGSSVVHAIVRALDTSVILSGSAQLIGALACDNLTLTGNALLRISVDNKSPVVNAGADQSLQLPLDNLNLNGIVSDDGLPADFVSQSWSKVSGSGSVTFENPSDPNSKVSFSSAGPYVLRLTATDGQLTASDDVTIAVNPPNQPPTANAGPDQIITLPGKAALAGTVTDDGLPAGLLTAAWSKVSGSGNVVFGNPASAATDATFSVAGSYVLRLTASDSVLFSSDDVIIIVKPQNFAPAVNAGQDQTITLPAAAQLNGNAGDDGLPEGSSVTVT